MTKDGMNGWTERVMLGCFLLSCSGEAQFHLPPISMAGTLLSRNTFDPVKLSGEIIGGCLERRMTSMLEDSL